MYCDSCGTAIQVGQQFCSRCGKAIVPGLQTQARQDRVREHIRLLGILWLALGALNALGGVTLLIVANVLFGPHGSVSGAPYFLQPLLNVLGIIVLAKAAVEFLAGWGLLQYQPWARTLTLVIAFIALFHFPFGTALGIYALWVLLPSESKQQYDALVQTSTVQL
jgi:predicted nucleic acid-binding Zn ribbon protein